MPPPTNEMEVTPVYVVEGKRHYETGIPQNPQSDKLCFLIRWNGACRFLYGPGEYFQTPRHIWVDGQPIYVFKPGKANSRISEDLIKHFVENLELV